MAIAMDAGNLVGRARVELATSRLSGVRSNHLSYRPHHAKAKPKGRGRQKPAQADNEAKSFVDLQDEGT